MSKHDDRAPYDTALTYYADLFESHPWLKVELCWTLISPRTEISDRELGKRLTLGGEWEARTAHIDELSDDDIIHVSCARLGSLISLFEIGHHASRPDVLAELSRGAEVASVRWNVQGNNRLDCSADGGSTLSIDIFEPEEWPPNVHNNFPFIEAFKLAHDERVAALSFVELSHGGRLGADFLEGISNGFIFPYFPFRRRNI